MTQHTYFSPRKAKEQPTACSTHISQQAKSHPTSWKVYHTAGYLQAVIEKDGKIHKMDDLQELGTASLVKACSDYFA